MQGLAAAFVVGLLSGAAGVVWWVRPFFQRARPLRYIRPVTDYSRHRVYR